MSSIGRWTAFPGAFQESVSPRISTSIMRLLAENLVAKALAGVYFSSKPGWRNKAACMSCAPEMRRSACAARMTVSECVPLHATVASAAFRRRSRWHASSGLTANICLHRGTMLRYLIGILSAIPCRLFRTSLAVRHLRGTKAPSRQHQDHQHMLEKKRFSG